MEENKEKAGRGMDQLGDLYLSNEILKQINLVMSNYLMFQDHKNFFSKNFDCCEKCLKVYPKLNDPSLEDKSFCECIGG